MLRPGGIGSGRQEGYDQEGCHQKEYPAFSLACDDYCLTCTASRMRRLCCGDYAGWPCKAITFEWLRPDQHGRRLQFPAGPDFRRVRWAGEGGCLPG